MPKGDKAMQKPKSHNHQWGGSVNNGFNLKFLARFLSLQKHLFSKSRPWSFLLFFLLISFLGVEEYVASHVMLVSGAYYRVLGEKDKDGFLWHTLYALGLLIGMTVVKCCRILTGKSLVVEWRRNLTTALQRKYFSNQLYYDLNVMPWNKWMDNLDQRLTADAELVSTTYNNIVNNIFITPGTLAYYTYSAYTKTGWVGPTSMYGMFAVNAIVNKLLMSPVARQTFKKEKREGNFRYHHVSLRVNSEPFAFYGPEATEAESSAISSKLDRLCWTQQLLYIKEFFLDLDITLFGYLGSIASYLAIAVPIFSGFYDDVSGPELAEAISVNATVCMYLVFQLTKWVEASDDAGTLAGVTHRVSQVFESVKVQGKQAVSTPTIWKEFEGSEPEPATEDLVMSIQGLDLYSPDGRRALIVGLSLDIQKGRRYLVTGPSSVGKTSLIRAIRGLWPISQGSIQLLQSASFCFIPQKPFIGESSTLRELIVYPKQPTYSPEEGRQISELMSQFGLQGLLVRLGGSLDNRHQTDTWSEELSPGEVQIVAFLRLLYSKAEVAILDEATSAVPLAVEEELYRECIKRSLTIISVGHRTSLVKFHEYILQLGEEGTGWKVLSAEEI